MSCLLRAFPILVVIMLTPFCTDRAEPSKEKVDNATRPQRPLNFGECLRFGDVEALKDIIEAGSGDDLTLPRNQLHKSFLLGHDHMAEYLIDKMGVDVNALGSRDETALFWAIRTNQFHMLRVFVDHGGDVNHRNRAKENALHYAAFEGFLGFAEALLDLGVSPSQRSAHMGTPLHYAIFGGNISCVELLIKRGASLDSQNKWEHTPLQIACQKGNPEIAELLIRSGASVPVLNKDHTELHLATRNGLTEIIKLLLEKNADANAKDRFGMTPTFWALGNIDALEHLSLLKAHGARFDVRDPSGKNLITELADIECYRPLELLAFLVEQGVEVEPHALEIAREKGNHELVAALNGYLD